MKASFFAAILLCAMGAAVAQAPNPQKAAAHEAARMDRLAILLDLNDGQKAQVQTVLEEERAKIQATFEQAKASGTRPTPEQMRANREQLKAETLQKLSTVLTESQLRKLQILGFGFGGGPRDGFRRHGPPPPPPSSGNQN